MVRKKCKLGQATLELLILFVAGMAVIGMLVFAVSSQNEIVQEKIAEAKRISVAESAALAVGQALYGGRGMAFDFHEENVDYRIENGHFYVVHGEKTIEIGGVFSDDPAEPL